jgi:hypothetical protein
MAARARVWWRHPAQAWPETEVTDDDGAKQKRAADQAIELVLQSELVHDESDIPYALIVQNGIRKVFPIKSRAFKHVLLAMFRKAHGRFLKPGEINEAVFQLAAMATIEGRKVEIDLRVAGDMQCVDIDLGTDDWTMVHITKDGWSVVPHGERLFRRPKGMLALPEPVRGGNIEDIRRYINVSDNDFPLVVSWLVSALHPSGPYRIFWTQGEYGSAKSSAARILRELIDPNDTPLHSPPRELNNLQLVANQSWVIVFDNMSTTGQALSDELCRISTGGGSARRELYTTDELTSFNAKRPIIITSIHDVVEYPDLLSRCLTVRPEPIAANKVLTETEFWEAFNNDAPQLFGALLDGVVSALANRANVLAKIREQQKWLPVRPDAYVWSIAAAPGLGVSAESIEQAWMRTTSDAHATTLESCIITVWLLDFLRHRNFEWVGTMGELLNLLEQLAGPTVTKRREWPDNPRALSAMLADITPSLRVMYGIDHRDLGRKGHDKHRMHSFCKVREEQAAQAAQDAAAHAAHAACSLRRKLIATNPDLKLDGHPQLANAKYRGAKISRPKSDPTHAFLNPSNGKTNICYVCRKRWDQHGMPGRRDWNYIRAVSPPLG